MKVIARIWMLILLAIGVLYSSYYMWFYRSDTAGICTFIFTLSLAVFLFRCFFGKTTLGDYVVDDNHENWYVWSFCIVCFLAVIYIGYKVNEEKDKIFEETSYIVTGKIVKKEKIVPYKLSRVKEDPTYSVIVNFQNKDGVDYSVRFTILSWFEYDKLTEGQEVELSIAGTKPEMVRLVGFK